MRYEVRQYIGTSNNYNIIDNVSIPISYSPKLNESKDEAQFTIVATTQKKRISKNTRIEIVELDSNKKLQFIVVKDSVTRIQMVEPYLYNHDVLLIESSALLENRILPSISFSRETANFYTISNATDFNNISKDLNGNYTITADFTIASLSSFGDFNGTINGNGHTITITTLNISNTTNSFGIFNSLSSTAIINNVNFIVTNCSFTITTNTNINHNAYTGFGLIAGINNGRISQVNITNSNITIHINQGIFDNTSGVRLCIGMVGVNNGTISKCWLQEDLFRFENGSSAQNGYIGSVAGVNNGTIINVASYECVIQTTQYLGYKIMQGGFVGYNQGSISNSYCYRPAMTWQNVIRVVGFTPILNASTNINNCYFHITTTESTQYLITDSLGTFISLSGMEQQSTYVNFDFNSIWKISSSATIKTPTFLPFSNIAIYNPLSIQNILNRLLKLAKPIFLGQNTEFEISSSLITRLQELNYTDTAEFFFNELNLWEALLEIGGKINAIPFLEDYKYINYKFLNTNIQEWIPPAISECGYSQYQDPETYTTNLISYGKNVVVSEDETLGVLEYPYVNGYMTPRTLSSQSARIINDTSVLWIGLQIYDIESVKLKNVDLDNPNTIYDITKYIYEKNQYDALPSLEIPTSTYPNVQGRALIYDQYGEYIYGLTNQPIAGFTPPYTALANILEFGLGISNPNTDFKTILFNIRFRTNFDNVTNTIKKSLTDFPFDVDLLLNQTVNQVSSTNFGAYKNYKMDKMGNIAENRRYVFDNFNDIPERGAKLVDEDLYVNEINAELNNNIIVATISFTKNFNKISEFISVNSRKRPFKIALDNIQDSHRRYEEFIRFTSSPNILKGQNDYTKSHITDMLLKNIFYPVGIEKTGNMNSVNQCIAKTFDENQKQIASLLLPVSSYAQPRGITFSFQMNNNYGAGYYADNTTNISSDGYINRTVLYAKNGVFDSIKVNYLSNFTSTDTALDTGRTLPNAPQSSTINDYSVFDIDDYLLELKDNRETFYLTSQIHFINEENDIIIGNNLSYNCLAVKDASQYPQAKLYVLNRKLEDYEYAVPLDATEIAITSITQNDIIDKNGDLAGVDLSVVPTETSTYKSWFLADNNGQIIIGKQLPLYEENHIYAFKQLTRVNTEFESILSTELVVNTDISVLTDIDINIIGTNTDKNQYIDFGDGIIETFRFDEYGQYRILHTYAQGGDRHIKIYADNLTGIYAYPQEYIFKQLYIYTDNMESVMLYNNEFYSNVIFTELDFTGQTNINTIDVSNVSTLTNLILDDNNQMQNINLSYTGMVNNENMLLDIANKLPDRTGIQQGTFTCIGTLTPLGYAYWESVLNVLNAKNWDYVWSD